MIWKRLEGECATDVLDRLFKSNGWAYRVSINPAWCPPEFVRSELGNAHLIEFTNGAVVAILSSYDPNEKRYETPMFWVGEP